MISCPRIIISISVVLVLATTIVTSQLSDELSNPENEQNILSIEPERNHHCRPDKSSLADCSGRGICVGGLCKCENRHLPDEIISGQFCECDNFSCDRHNGLLCSGSDYGICSCGTCLCERGWTGDACDCRASNETCIGRGGEICSGHGTCECGACRCEVSVDGCFSGRYCEKCPTCHELRNCVQCQMYKTGPLAASDRICASNCTKFVTIGVDTIRFDESKEDHLCTFYDEDDCRYQFVYRGLDALEVWAQNERECPPKVSIQYFMFLGLGVITGVVVIGLAVLLLRKL